MKSGFTESSEGVGPGRICDGEPSLSPTRGLTSHWTDLTFLVGPGEGTGDPLLRPSCRHTSAQ